MEYVCYNGFDAVTLAFSKVALIFSDGGYKGLFAAVIVIGMLLGATGAMVRATTGAKASPLSWGVPVMVGVVLYLGLVVPKGSIVVYDEVLNKSQTISDVPDGIVLVAGVLNKLERGLVDIVSTSGEPASYHQQAGGIGFDMLLNIEYAGALFSDQYLHASLNNYTKDCVFFELMRPGTTLTVNSLAKNEDALSEYAKAGNPAVYTVIHTEDDTRGTTYTCDAAWLLLQQQLATASNYDDITKARCADAGFDPTNATELNRCKEILTNTVNYIHNASYNHILYYQQKIVTQSLIQSLATVSPDTTAALFGSVDKGSAAMSAGIMFSKWLPSIKGVMTAIAIGMIPFFVLFLPTPYWRQALGITTGFFLWLTAWGVTDAVIHGFAMDYGRRVATEVAQYQLGYLSFLNFQTAGQKTMAMFAMVRSSGLMLATVITGMLMKFGGHALSSLSGQLTGAVTHGQTPGLSEASRGRAQSELASGAKGYQAGKDEYGDWMMAGHSNSGYGFRSRVDAAMARETAQGRGFAQLKSSFGADGAIDAMAGTQVGRAIQGAATQNMRQSIGAGEMTALATADQNALVGTAQRHGMSPAGLKRLMATGTSEQRASAIETFRELSGAGTDHEATVRMAAAAGLASGSQGMVTQNLADTLGAGGIAQAGTVGELNLAANRQMMLERLQHLGYAGNAKDFQGILEGRKAANGTENFMLSNQSAVDRLNADMRAQGKRTRFTVGDQVQIGMSPGGAVTLAKATRGASRDALDISKSLAGCEDVYKDISKSETGWENVDKGINRGEYGSSTTRYATNEFHGVREIADPGNPGKKMLVKADEAYDQSGKLVSATYTNDKTGQIVTERTVAGPKGEKTRQWSVGQVHFAPNGLKVIDNFKTLSERTVNKGGFATSQFVDEQDGAIVYEEGKKGQAATYRHTYTHDLRKDVHMNYGSGVVGEGTDVVGGVSDGQLAGLFALEVANQAYQTISRGANMGTWRREGIGLSKTSAERRYDETKAEREREKAELRNKPNEYRNPNNPDHVPSQGGGSDTPAGGAPTSGVTGGTGFRVHGGVATSPTAAAVQNYLSTHKDEELTLPGKPASGGKSSIADSDMSKGKPRKRTR
jgi:hypothetical protein